MSSFVISFDTNEGDLFWKATDLLDSIGAARLLPALWTLSADLGALEIRNALKELLGADDGIAILEIHAAGSWACENAEAEGLEWLREAVGA